MKTMKTVKTAMAMKTVNTAKEMKTVKAMQTVKAMKAMKTVTAMKAMKQQHSSFYEPLELQNSKPQHSRKKSQVCCPLS